MHLGFPLLAIFRLLLRNLHRHPSAAQGSRGTFTPSILHNLGLPRTLPSLSSVINTHLAMRYSFILSMCPNQQNTPNHLHIQLIPTRYIKTTTELNYKTSQMKSKGCKVKENNIFKEPKCTHYLN